VKSICFVTSGVGCGGAEKQLFAVAAALQANGSSVTIVSILSNDEDKTSCREAGVPVVSLNARRDTAPLSILWRFKNELATIRPDVLVGFNYPGTMLARAAALVTRTPGVISSIRSERIGGLGRRAALRLTDRLARVTTTNSHIVAKRLVQAGLVSRARMRVIPNGIDAEAITPDLRRLRDDVRRALDVSPDTFLWVAAGRLEPPKDYANLIDAFALVRDTGSRLFIAGEGPLRQTLEQQSKRHRLTRSVTFLGFVPDVPRIIAAADAFVLSSAWEGMPNVLMEALAVGIPVVSTDVGGVREVVLNGVAGCVVPPRAPDQLASAMRQMMAIPRVTRMRMGEEGRRHIETNFSMTHAVRQWLALTESPQDARSTHSV